jgi:uncharacterized protein YndB with AHSA1/START domain
MTTDGFTIERTFDAPRDLVWKALTEPAQFAVWFGGDHAEVPVDSVAMDVRPGGTWQAKMIAGGAEMDWKGEYVEVDEPERLVFTITHQPDNPARDTITVTLAENDGKTDMTYHQGGGNLDPAGYEQAKQGTGTFLDKLEELVASR